MKLVSLNIALGSRLKELVDFIKNESKTTDVFVFQEVTEWKRQKLIDAPGDHSGGIETYAALKKALPNFRSYKSKKYTSLGEFLGTFVKKTLKIGGTRQADLAGPVRLFNLDTFPKILCVKVVAGINTFWACNTHGLLIPRRWREDTPERILQSKKIIRVLSTLTGPKILCGDFNLPPHTKTMDMLGKNLENLVVRYKIKNTRSRSYLNGADYAHGAEITDHVLISKEIKVKRFKVVDAEISDHLPLVLEFSL